MQIKKISTSLATVTLLSLFISSAKATTSYTTTTETVTTSPGVVTTTPGTVVYFRTASPDALVTTLQGRRLLLENSIDQACARGEISSEQSAALKRELGRIAQETSSTTISYPVAVMLAQDLDFIGQQYGTIITTAPAYVPIISGTRYTISTGQTFELDDLSARRANLESRVTKAVYQGRLSSSRAAELRMRLANIGNEANLYSTDGNVDAKESRRLYDAFDRVASDLEKYAGKDKDPV